MGKILIIVGIALVVAGVLWMIGDRLGLGRLPGDILIERDGTRIYIPITTSLLISAVVSLILWLMSP
jgi:heme/copper-type cytochrome/quinol oxidase subunit 4